MSVDSQPPAPFEIIERDGRHFGSNGGQRVALLDAGGRMFKRRGMKGISSRTAADLLLPKINQLAGELLAHPDMPARDAAQRLRAIAGLVSTEEPKRVEWLVAELDGVRVYCDGENVVITREELTP